MQPKSEPSKLEGKGQFHEYRAAGKLQGASALITGGEYVSAGYAHFNLEPSNMRLAVPA